MSMRFDAPKPRIERAYIKARPQKERKNKNSISVTSVFLMLPSGARMRLGTHAWKVGSEISENDSLEDYIASIWENLDEFFAVETAYRQKTQETDADGA